MPVLRQWRHVGGGQSEHSLNEERSESETDTSRYATCKNASAGPAAAGKNRRKNVHHGRAVPGWSGLYEDYQVLQTEDESTNGKGNGDLAKGGERIVDSSLGEGFKARQPRQLV